MNPELPSTTATCNRPEQPLISLIIPVYNAERYLAECLESVLCQTLRRIEIICIDDGSTDASAAILQEYAGRDERLTIVRHAENKGVATTRNVGLSHCRAPFIMFVDSDDTCAPTICEKLHEAITSSASDIAICGTHVTYEADASRREMDADFYSLKYEGKKTITEELEASCDCCLWNKIFRKEMIDGYDIRFPDGLLYEDACFFHSYMAHARSIMFISEKLYHYRRRADSIMNQTFAKTGNMSKDHVRVAMALFEHYRRWNLLDEKYGFFCSFWLTYIDIALQHCPALPDKEDILLLAGNFTRANLGHTDTLSRETANRIEYLKHISPSQARGGIWRVCTSPWAKRYVLLGLPVYTIKYTPRNQKHYLFGIQVYRHEWRR